MTGVCGAPFERTNLSLPPGDCVLMALPVLQKASLSPASSWIQCIPQFLVSPQLRSGEHIPFLCNSADFHLDWKYTYLWHNNSFKPLASHNIIIFQKLCLVPRRCCKLCPNLEIYIRPQNTEKLWNNRGPLKSLFPSLNPVAQSF